MAKNFFKGRGTPLFLFHTKDETKKIKIRDKKLYCNQRFHCVLLTFPTWRSQNIPHILLTCAYITVRLIQTEI